MNRNRSLLTIILVLSLVIITLGSVEAQVRTWAVCNAFNLIRANDATIWIPGDYNTGDYPLMPSGPSPEYTLARINTWRYATTLVKYDVPGGTIAHEAGAEVFEEASAVLKLDLRSHGRNVQFRAVTLTLLGNADFAPNEDLLPIFPDSASFMFYGQPRETGVSYLEPVDTLTGVEIFDEAGTTNSRSTEPWRKNRFDSDDIRARVEALTDSFVQQLDSASFATHKTSPKWVEYTTAQIRILTNNPNLGNPPAGWHWWRADFTLRQPIDISDDNSQITPGLAFKRIWIILRPSGCHQCRDNGDIGRPGTPNTIEGFSNQDQFYTLILRKEDVVCYDVVNPWLVSQILPLASIRVLPDFNNIWTPANDGPWTTEKGYYDSDPTRARWAVAERINGKDTDNPIVNNIVPFNTVCTNGPNSGVGQQNDTMIFTADSTQVISFSVKDMGACIDSVVVRIEYLNWVGSQFPNRSNNIGAANCIDTIIFRNMRPQDTWDTGDSINSGFANGWEYMIRHSAGCGATSPWIADLNGSSNGEAAIYSACNSDSIIASIDTVSNCPLVLDTNIVFFGQLYPWEFADTFYIRVGKLTNGTNYLNNFIDGARVRVQFDAWDRTNRGPGHGNTEHKQVDFTVDLSGPNAEMECPNNTVFMDDSTRELRRWTRQDVFEGENRYWVFLSDSLPTFTFRLYDDYGAASTGEVVHDTQNHGTGYWGRGVGGGGINIRQMDLVFRHVPCEGEPYEISVFSDSSTDFANEMAGHGMNGVIWTEDADGLGGRMTVDLARQYEFETDWALRNGEIIFLIARRLFDDMDWGQSDADLNYSLPIYEPPGGYIRYDDDYYRDCIADPNYGTRHRFYQGVGDNHVVLDQQVIVAACNGYTQFMEDTMGIIRMDFQGPKFDAVTYYPPPAYITSDSFQVITVDIYDPQTCTGEALGNYGDSLAPGAASGVYAPHPPFVYNYETEHSLPYVNIKVKHCDGSYNNYYSNSHSTADRRRSYATPADGRDFFLDDEDVIIDTLFHGGVFSDRVGIKVIWDPRETEDVAAAKFRSGDKVCVTVHTWDNAVNWCAMAGPDGVDTTRNPMMNWTPTDPDFPMPPDPDWPYWFFYVDYMPPVMIDNNLPDWTACDDTLFFWLNDINDSVSNGCPVQTNWIAGVGCVDVTLKNRAWPVPADGWYNETDSGLVIFSPNAIDPSRIDTSYTPWNRVGNPQNLYEDLIIVDSLCMGDYRRVAHVDNEYHTWIGGSPIDSFTIGLFPWGEDGAVVKIYDPTCLMFMDLDAWEFGMWAGDNPTVPWFPATRRVPPGWIWDHWYVRSATDTIGIDEGAYSRYRFRDHYNWINNDVRPARRRQHVYENTRTCDQTNPIVRTTLHITDADDTTPYRHLQADWENPNWTKVLGAFAGATTDNACWLAGVQNPEAFPFRTKLYKKTQLNTVRWFNTDGFWNMIDIPDHATFDISGYDVVGGDLMGQYTRVLDSLHLPNWYYSTRHYQEDVYTTHFVNNEMNYLVAEIVTCMDSIILECEDTVFYGRYRTPTLYMYRVRGATTDTLFYDHYDCYCSTCQLQYYPDRDGCTDIGRLVAGPLGNQYQWRYLDRSYVNGPFGPNQPTDPYPLQTGDEIVCTLYVNTRTPVQFGDPDLYTLYKFIWRYTVDNMGPTQTPGRFEFSLNTTSGYEEVNCVDRFDGNSTVRVRLNGLQDVQTFGTRVMGVGIDGNSTNGENWGVLDRPMVVWNSDSIIYQLNRASQRSWIRWNDLTVQLWSNEELPIIHCFDDTFFNIAEPRRIDEIPRDTITFADTLFGVVTVQDKLGNETRFDPRPASNFWWNGEVIRLIPTTPPDTFTNAYGDRYIYNDTTWVHRDTIIPGTNPIVLDNDLPMVKHWNVYYSDTVDSFIRTDTLPPYDYLPSVVIDADARDTIVYFVLTFDDNMDISNIDGDHDPVVRFRPFNWARWVPVFPVLAADMRFHPELLRSGVTSSDPSAVNEDMDGWHTDFQWIGYARIPRYYMDGFATLRVSGFDDNAGNQQLTQDFEFFIGTFTTHRPDIIRPDHSPISSATAILPCDNQWRLVDSLWGHINDSDTVIVNRRPDTQVRWQIFADAGGRPGTEITPTGWNWGPLADTIRQVRWFDVVPPRSGTNPGTRAICVVFSVNFPTPFTDRADTTCGIVIDNRPPDVTITSPVANEEFQSTQFTIPILISYVDSAGRVDNMVVWTVNVATLAEDTVYNGVPRANVPWNNPGPGVYNIFVQITDWVGQVDCYMVEAVHIINPAFLSRGDNWTESMLGDYDDVRPMYPVLHQTNVVNWPTWAFFCDAEDGPVAAYPELKTFQITTFDNNVGTANPLLPDFTSPIDYPGDTLYVLVYATEDMDSVLLVLEDEEGGRISGSNLVTRRMLRAADIRTGAFRYASVLVPEGTHPPTATYFVMPWIVDDQDNRFDGPVKITATIYSLDHSFNLFTTVNNSYILLDTSDPEFHARYSRNDSTDAPLRHESVPGTGEVWFTNADDILMTIGWDQTVFDQGTVEDFVRMPAVARNFEYVGLTIDGQPEGLNISDPNDHISSRAWIDYIYDAGVAPLSWWYTEIAHPGYPGYCGFGSFGDTLYKYNVEISDDPRGAGMAHIMMKGRDAAGNVLDYEESGISTSTGRYLFIDLVPPMIACGTGIRLGPTSMVVDPGTIDDDNLANFTPYVYVQIFQGATPVSGEIWVNADGGTDPWSAAVSETLSGDYTIIATDLAGNSASCNVTVAPILDCVTYNFCRGYNFVSVPLTGITGTTATEIFGSFVTNVRAYVGGAMVDSTDMTLVPGVGYLVTSNVETTVTICGNAVRSQTITLVEGWNWVGSIFGGTYDLTLSPDCVDHTEMYGFDCASGWVRSTQIHPGEGAMILVVSVPCELTMGTGTGGRVVVNRPEVPLAWNIDLNIHASGEAHNLTLGAASGATAAYDEAIDVPALPKWEGTDAYVENGTTVMDRLTRDVRGMADAYTFNVRTVNTTDMAARWNLANLPADLMATLYVDGKAYDMASVSHLNLTAKRFSIEVTRRAVPTAYALGEAEPNPFNVATEISYSTPVEGNVTVKIVNVLGHEVKTLVSGSVVAGTHSLGWDGTDNNGNTVEAGVYLYKLEAGEFTATRSLILVK